jgi:hypothetical protein
MAQKTQLTVLISHDGTVTIEVDGVRGASCLGLTQELEEGLGFVLERERKSAFYDAEGKVLLAAGENPKGRP